MKSKNYKDLIVWQKSMDLAVLVYDLTKAFPKDELYGLVSQMRRCVVSISSNIAEGSRRSTNKDFRQFVIIAFGSGAELETQLELAHRLEMGKPEQYIKINSLLDEVMRMLNALASTLQTTN